MKRFATSILEGLGRKLWGFPPNLMSVIVDELGPIRALGWFVRNMPRYEKTLKKMGSIRTHLVAVEISLLNGCPYCTYGHALAFELIYLKEHDRVFPLSEKEITDLHRLDEAEIRERLCDALRVAGLADEIPVFERVLALRAGESEINADDARIAHLLKMFSVLNTCGINGNVTPDQAHDPINKSSELKTRYEQLRAAQQASESHTSA